MTSVTRSRALPRARSALVSAAVLLLLAGLGIGLAGCDSGDDIEGTEDGSPSGRATDAPEVTTLTTIEHADPGLDAVHQARVTAGVTAVLDPFFDSAFLGDFPRTDFAAAFTAFTKGAAVDAQRDIDTLSNASIADQIDAATATNRRVRIDVFAHQGHPRGVTAYFVLDFTTTGDLEESRRVHGAFYLAKDKGEWKVFGYDVDEAVQL